MRLSDTPIKMLLIAGALGMTSIGPAYAESCNLGNVTWGGADSGNCQVGNTNNDKVSVPLTVNDENFFGYSDWEYVAKYNAETGIQEGPEGSLLTLTPATGENKTGTWSFAGTLDYEDVMIVLKAGNGFEGYLYGAGIPTPTSGTWDSGSAFNKDLSHLTLYKRGALVPIPAAAWLFGSALLGLAGIGYRRRGAKV